MAYKVLIGLVLSCMYSGLNAQNTIKNCLHFDGNQYVTSKVTLPPSAPNTFTIEARFKSQNNLDRYGMPRIISWNNGADSRIEIGVQNGYLTIVDYPSSQMVYTTSHRIVDSLWHHVAYVLRGGIVSLYFDGELVSTKQSKAMAGRDLIIGSWYEQSEKWMGCIDEVRIWSVARSQQQIKANMNELSSKEDKRGLIIWYSFDQGVANADNSQIDKLINSVSNAAPAVLNNFPLNGYEANFVSEEQAFPAPQQSSYTYVWGGVPPVQYDERPYIVTVTDVEERPCAIPDEVLVGVYLGLPIQGTPDALRAALKARNFKPTRQTKGKSGITLMTIDTFYFGAVPNQLRAIDLDTKQSFVTFTCMQELMSDAYSIRHVEIILATPGRQDQVERYAIQLLAILKSKTPNSYNMTYVYPGTHNNNEHMHSMIQLEANGTDRCSTHGIHYTSIIADKQYIRITYTNEQN
jgi:hypothetical protein